MLELFAFLFVAFLTWRIILSSYNQLAHYLNAGMDNEAITHESQLDRLLVSAGRYYDERKWVPAEKAYLKVLKLDHKNIQAYRRLAMVYSHLHNYEDAIECFEVVIRSSNSASDWQNLATVLYRNGRVEEAVEAIKKSNRLEVSVSRLLTLARFYEALDQLENARRTLRDAHKLEPDNEMIKKYMSRL